MLKSVIHDSLIRTSGVAVKPSRDEVSVLGLSPTASPTALALVLGGLLDDGLLGPLLKPGVGAADVMSGSGVGEAGAVDPLASGGGAERRPIRRSMAVSCLPAETFFKA